MTDAVGILAVIVLIAANGYFVAAEFAFVASRRQKLAAAADAGDKKARRAVAVHRRLSFMLSGAQLGITVTSLVLGFIARPAIAGVIAPVVEWAGLPEGSSTGVSIAIAFVLATIAQMVFGELAPKNLAIAKPEPVARAVAGSTLVFMKVAGPVIRLFDGSANRLLRLLGIEPVEELHGAVSVDELDLIVGQSAGLGHLSPAQAALLDRALEFDRLLASDAMVPWHHVDTLAATDGVARAVTAAADRSRLPVVDAAGAVIGVLHAHDLLDVERSGGLTVASLARSVVAVPETARLPSVLAELRSSSAELAIVVDEYGGSAGIVTLEDVVEELVGEIEDEHDADPVAVAVALDDGGWSVAGAARPDEVARATGLDVPEGGYETMAGLVLERLQRTASVGDAVTVEGLAIEVIEVEGYAIGRLVLRAIDDIGSDEAASADRAEDDDAPDGTADES